MNPVKKYRELRRKLKRASDKDKPTVQAEIQALWATLTPKQQQQLTEEYADEAA